MKKEAKEAIAIVILFIIGMVFHEQILGLFS